MKKILLYILFFIPCILSCTDESPIDKEILSVESKKVNVTLDINIPAERLPSQSRASYTLDMILFSFDQSGNYLSHVVYDDQSVPEKNEKTALNVTLLESNTPVKLVLIANSALTDPTIITKESDLSSLVFTQLSVTEDKTTESITDEANIPMWGECTLNSVAQGVTGHIDLLRALAKLSVTVADDSGLSDVSVKLLNISTSGQIVPTLGESVTIPSENSIASISKTGSQVSFFIPESISGTETANRISVILKAKYNDSEDFSYYRLDLYTKGENGELLTQLQRNHHYVFSISLVNHAGYASEEAAISAVNADNKRIIGGEVFVIEDTGILEITTDEYYYFGVNSSELSMIQSDGYKVARLKIITNNAENFSYELSDNVQVTFPEMLNNVAAKTWVRYTGTMTTGTLGTITLISGNIRKDISLVAE